MKIEFVAGPNPPFTLTDATQAASANLFQRITTYNQFADEVGPPSQRAECLRIAISLLHEVLALLDSIEGELAQAIAEARTVESDAVAKANADLVAAGIATEETVWAFADKLQHCKPVADARQALQLVSEWHSQGTRQLIQQSVQRASHELLGLESVINQRESALVI